MDTEARTGDAVGRAGRTRGRRWRAVVLGAVLAAACVAGTAPALFDLQGAVWRVAPPAAVLALALLVVAQRATGSYPTGTTIDPLTGLATGTWFRQALAVEASRAARAGRTLGVLVVEVEGLDDVNTTDGRSAGDDVLRTVAARIEELAGASDLAARTSGDRFALLVPSLDAADARGLADRVRSAVSVPITAGGATITVSASVGVAVIPDDTTEPAELLVEAELAAAYARAQGGDRVAAAGKLPDEFRPAPLPESAPARIPDVDRRSADTPAPTRTPSGADTQLVRIVAEPLAQAKPATDRLLGLVVALAAAGAVIATLAEPAFDGGAALVLFAALAVGAEWFAESIYGRSSSSWSAVPLVALALVAPTPLPVVVGAVLAGAAGGALRGSRGRQVVFNIAVLVLATLAAYGVGSGLDDVGLHTDALVAAVGAGLVAGSAFFVIDVWFVAAAVALATGGHILRVWREDLLWLVPHQLGMSALGGAMAAAYVLFGAAGVALLSLPAVGLHLAQRQFVARTRDHVVRLRELNDDLQIANSHNVRVNERLTEALEQVNEGYLVTVESLAAAVDAKDSYTGSHIDRVEAYGRLLLEVVDPELSDDEQLLWGFRLHDVGKIGVPDRVLLKPEPLDDDEWQLMRRHPEIGADIIAAAPFLQGARDIVLHHHERWDGGGYPFGLSETAIPFGARLFSLVDAFDAMTSDRPYRGAMPLEAALREILRVAGTQFDPEMVEAMLQVPLDRLSAVPALVAAAREQNRQRSRIGGLLIPITSGYAEFARV